MSFARVVLAAVLTLLILFPVAGSAASTQAWSEDAASTSFSVELGFDVATGSYGNPTSTTTVGVPLSISWFPTPRLDLGLSIPYLWQSNQQVVGGHPVRTAAKTARPMQMPGQKSRTQAVNGVGDLLLSAGYAVLAESETLPQLRPVCGVKVPTASDQLGTGAADYLLGVDLAKLLGEWYLYAGGNYTFQGKTELFQARDYADYTVMVGYEVLPGARPALALRGATPAETGVGSVLQLEGRFTYTLSRLWDLKLHLGRGLTRNTADWEGGSSLSYNF